jgi:hypothetical protein
MLLILVFLKYGVAPSFKSLEISFFSVRLKAKAVSRGGMKRNYTACNSQAEEPVYLLIQHKSAYKAKQNGKL